MDRWIDGCMDRWIFGFSTCIEIHHMQTFHHSRTDRTHATWSNTWKLSNFPKGLITCTKIESMHSDREHANCRQFLKGFNTCKRIQRTAKGQEFPKGSNTCNLSKTYKLSTVSKIIDHMQKGPTHAVGTHAKCQQFPKGSNTCKWIQHVKIYHNSTPFLMQVCGAWGIKNKSKNTGWTSVDRSTRATLSTYNTWIQLGRLQKIYHFHCPKWCFTARAVASISSLNAIGPILILVMWQW